MSNNKTNWTVALSVTLVVAVTAAWAYAIHLENVKAMITIVMLAPALITLAMLVTADLPIRAAFGEPQFNGRNYVRPTQNMWATAIVVSSVFAGYAAVLITLAFTLISIRPTMFHIPCLIAAGLSATFAFVLAKHAVRIRAVQHSLQMS